MKELLKQENITKIAVAVGAVLIFIIFVYGTFGKNDNVNASDVSSESKIEQRISDLLSSIDGIDALDPPHVMIRLDKDGITVIGAAVVCSSAQDPILKEKMIECVSKTLCISFAEICVTY